MVPGFNTDFKYRGQTFHVQTEDNGTANPVVVSLLYHKGAILASRKSSYAELVRKGEYVEQLKELMKSQHKTLMRELLAGVYDAKIPATAAKTESRPSPPPPAATAAAAPGATHRPATTPAAAERPRPAGGLHEAILRYLEEYAATAAAH